MLFPSNSCVKTDYTTGEILSTQHNTRPDIAPAPTKIDCTPNATFTAEQCAEAQKEVDDAFYALPVPDPLTAISESITCDNEDGCYATNSSVMLFWGECCVNVRYLPSQKPPGMDNREDGYHGEFYT